MRERLINRRQQGDLGEASAIEWLTRQGATVSVPVGHSPDYDLIAEMDGRPLRVQVKTSTRRDQTADGHERWTVVVRTNGGNQSWTGITKRFDPTRVEALFVLVGDGRRWFIPAWAVEAVTDMRLGSTKYSEFEIEPVDAIHELVYGAEAGAPRIDGPIPGERRSRRAGPACKVGALALSEFDSHLPHQARSSQPGRSARVSGQTRISANHQVTIPVAQFTAAELAVGDRMRVAPDGIGRIILERIEPRTDQPLRPLDAD